MQSLDFPDGTYFFEQTTYRKRPRRQRKRLEDLPKVNLFDLRIDTQFFFVTKTDAVHAVS